MTTQFRIQLRTPGTENCLLWEEQQTKDLSSTNGVFTLTIADTLEPTLIANTLPFALERVFSNRTNFTALTGCSAGTAYNPTSFDGRVLVVFFRENPTDSWEQMPLTKINFVPLALNSVQLEGYQAAEFLKIDPASVYTTLTAANVNTLVDIIAGTNTQYLRPATVFAGDVSGVYSAISVDRVKGVAVAATAPTTGQVLKYDGTNWAPAADDAGTSPGDASYAAKGLVQVNTDQATSGLFIASGVLALPNVITAGGPTGSASSIPVISYDSKGRLTAVTTATVDDISKLPLAGGTMTGNLNMGAQQLTNAASVSANDFSGRNFYHYNLANSQYANIKAPDALGLNYTLTLPTTAPVAGNVLSTDASGHLSWISAAGGSVTSVTGTAPIVSSGGATPAISLDTGNGLTVSSNNLVVDAGLLANKIPQVGGTALGANGVVIANGAASALTSLNCALDQVIKFDASGFATCGSDVGSANSFVQDGNSFGAAATIGTNDNFDLNFETNGTTKMTVLADGKVGIGTTSPNTLLHINSAGPTTSQVQATTNGAVASSYYRAPTTAGIDQRWSIGMNLSLSNADYEVYDSSASSSRLLIQRSTGNVGIGTTGPTSPLHIINTSSVATGGNEYGLQIQKNWSVGDSSVKTTASFYSSSYNTGVLTNSTVVGSSLSHSNGTLSNGYNYRAESNVGTGLITTRTGLRVDDTTGAGTLGTQYGIYIDSLVKGGTDNFAFYSSGSTKSYFGGNVGIGTTTPSTKLQVAGTVKVADGSETCTIAGDGGMIRYSGTSLQFCNGSSWQTLGVSGAGLTSLGGQSGSTQTFANGLSGTAPAFSSASDTHTLNIPLASGAGVTSGTISKTEYDAFTGKLTSPLTTKGDLLTRDGSSHVRLPAGTDGHILSANSATASGLEWIAAPAGDITDVVAGAGLTGGASSGSATVDVTAGTGIVVSANDVAVDVGLGVSKIPQVGGIALGANGVVVANGLGTALTSLNCTLNQVIKFDASGFANCGSDVGSATSFIQGGNSFGAAATLGTNDNFDLNFETNGTPKMTILANGNVGIGTSTPSQKFDVNGTIHVANGVQMDAGGYSEAEYFRSPSGSAFTEIQMGAATNIMQLKTAGTTRLTLDAIGNVGIGTATPLQTFSVIGSGYVSSQFGVGTTADLSKGQLRVETNFSTPAIYAEQFGVGPVATFLGGSVGIGTASPGETSLDIYGSVGAPTLDDDVSILTVRAAGTKSLKFGIDAGSNWLQGRDASIDDVFPISLNPAGGNVGIGTTGPTDKLHLYDVSAVNKPNVLLEGLGGFGSTIGLKLRPWSGMAANTYIQFGAFDDGATSARASIFVPNATNNGVQEAFSILKSSGNVGIGTTSPATKLQVAGTIKIANGAETCSIAGDGGMIRYSGTSLQFCNGTSWQTLGISGSGLTSLGGQSGSTQTFANGATGLAPAFSSATNVHTLNIPLAAGAGVTSGTISKTEYDSFVAKLTSPLTTKGDLLTRDGSSHVRLPAGTDGHILSANSATASGLEWIAAPAGDITDVVAGAGLTGGASSGSATVDIGAGTGIVVSANDVAVDVGLGISKIPQVGGIALGANGVVVANGLGTALTSLNCTVNQVIKFDASGFATCGSDVGSSTSFIQGGNSFGAAATLGTNDNFDLNFETNGTTWMSINGSGAISVNASDFRAGALLDIASGDVGLINTAKLRWSSGTNYYNSVDTGIGRNAAGVVEFNNGTAGTYRDIQIRSINPTSGNVGIGTATPSANLKLQVNGAAASKTNIISSGASIDLSLSNVHLLKSVGGAAITLSNMADGGSYTLIISDTTQRIYTFSGCTNSYYSPTNGQTFQQSSYSILVVVDGANTNCYINWTTGFN